MSASVLREVEASYMQEKWFAVGVPERRGTVLPASCSVQVPNLSWKIDD